MDWTSRAGSIFAEDFDRPNEPEPVEPEVPPEPIYSAADLEEARAAGVREGHAAGFAEADTSTASLARQAMLSIAEQLAIARTEARRIAEESAESIARLVMGAMGAAFPALCAQHAEREVRAAVRTIVPRLEHEPSITIRVSPHLARCLEDEIAAFDPDIGGKVRIIGTDSVPMGDVRVSWHGGQATRDTTRLWREIEAILAPNGLLGPSVSTARLVEEPEHV